MPILPQQSPSDPMSPGDEAATVVAFMGRVIEHLDARLLPVQRSQLATAMPAILWEFPDAGARVRLVATPDALRCSAHEEGCVLLVRMPLETLDDAAFGRRSLAVSFLAGRIAVRGMSPSRLREFILLVDPLLESYREAAREHSFPGTTPSDVP
jgi:hypothetical protein